METKIKVQKQIQIHTPSGRVAIVTNEDEIVYLVQQLDMAKKRRDVFYKINKCLTGLTFDVYVSPADIDIIIVGEPKPGLFLPKKG